MTVNLCSIYSNYFEEHMVPFLLQINTVLTSAKEKCRFSNELHWGSQLVHSFNCWCWLKDDLFLLCENNPSARALCISVMAVIKQRAWNRECF